MFAEHQGIEARTQYEGVGEGGDKTLVIDRLCEDAIFDELERLHDAGHEFTAVSEERGTVTFGGGESPLRVIIDPIDGSLNARRTIPLHSVSIAIAEGDSMADVTFGYVYEFGAEEEFIATSEGARLDGRPIHAPAGNGLEVIALEATKPERVLEGRRASPGQGLPHPRPRLDRGRPLLRRHGPLRRHDHDQEHPLRGCGGRSAGRPKRRGRPRVRGRRF